MYIVWGSRLMGKTDVVPGLFHVATKFGHIYYLPLIPMGSYVVLGEASGSFRGVPIGLSPKSILMAWGRAALFCAAIGVSIWAAICFGDKKAGDPVMACLFAGLLWFLFGMSWHKSVNRASFNRACAIGQMIGLSAAGIEIIQKVYGHSAMRGFDVKAATAPPPMRSPMAPPPISNAVRAAPVADAGAIPLEPETPPPAPTRAKPRGGEIGLT